MISKNILLSLQAKWSSVEMNEILNNKYAYS